MSRAPDAPELRPRLEGEAQRTARRFGMLGKAVLAGVSGGADSMALLHWLCARRETGLSVYAAHVNHLLRGGEALRDEETVRAFCRELGVELFVLRADVAARARERGESIEEAGRAVRYAFFAQKAEELERRFARETGGTAGEDAPAAGKFCVRVATAHTLSDRIETQLLNLARGTGPRGLCGIPPVRGRIVRPLIACTRADTEEYCRFYGIKYVDDSTNFSRAPARNRIRLDAVPVLCGINPAFPRAEERLFEILAEDEAYLEGQARELLARARTSAGAYRLEPLAQAEPALLRRGLNEAARLFSGAEQEFRHVEALAELVRRREGKAELHGGCFARVFRGQLLFSRPEEGDAAGFSFPFAPGAYQTPGFAVTITDCSGELAKNFENIKKQYFKSVVDCDRIKDNAVVRARAAGDLFCPAGRGVTKTLKKLLNEAGVPAGERSRVPVAADAEGVFWVGGFGTAQRCALRKETKRAFRIEIKNLEGSLLLDDIAEILLSKETLEKKVAELGAQISEDYKGKNLLMVGILKGSVVFMSDLMKQVSIPARIDFMSVSSYGAGTKTSGVVKIIKDLDLPLQDYDVLLVEDILDSGFTLHYLMQILSARSPRSLKICTLLDKPYSRRVDMRADYHGFDIPDKFVVGYGLDYAEKYRNLPFVGVLKPEVYKS